MTADPNTPTTTSRAAIGPDAAAAAYIALWNEVDAERRHAQLSGGWTEDVRYTDPLMSARGHTELGGLVAAVHERFPGFRFSLRGRPDGHGDHVRLAWSLGPDGAEAPIEGSDVLTLRDGRIAEVVGFLDKVPAGT